MLSFSTVPVASGVLPCLLSTLGLELHGRDASRTLEPKARHLFFVSTGRNSFLPRLLPTLYCGAQLAAIAFETRAAAVPGVPLSQASVSVYHSGHRGLNLRSEKRPKLQQNIMRLNSCSEQELPKRQTVKEPLNMTGDTWSEAAGNPCIVNCFPEVNCHHPGL